MEAWAVTFVLVLARLTAFMLTVPMIRATAVPRLVKAGLAVALTVCWTPQAAPLVEAIAEHDNPTVVWTLLAAATAIEATIGALLGLVFLIFTAPARIAGSYVGQELGLSMATMTDPTTNEHSTFVANLFEALALALFFGLDLHHFVFAAIYVSFAQLPVAALIVPSGFSDAGNLLAGTSHWGLSIVAPIGIFALVAIVALSLLNKLAPAFNLFSVGLGVRLLAGIAALAALTPVLVLAIQNYMWLGRAELLKLLESMGTW